MPAPEWTIQPRLPRRTDWRIGCAGAGFIMADCHLVAYRQAGFNPVAIASRQQATAQVVAQRHSIPTVHADYDSLLRDEQIEVLDIAVPPQNQPDLIRRAVELGRGRLRGILAQKPLALNLTEAREVVKLCTDNGVALAVNQNMRYDQSIRAAYGLLQQQLFGTPLLATINMRAVPHWMPWAEGLPSLSTFIMSIHHLDTFRYWFGTPQRVLASTRPDPRTQFPHADGINLYILEWDNGQRASSWDDVWAGPAKEHDPVSRWIHWRLEGTEGLAQGTIGWPSYPAREPSTIEFTHATEPGVWHRSAWQEVWFPDAFVGTMAQLLCAMEDGTSPEISGADHLETLALCEAVLTAATQHRVVTLQEVLDAKA